MRSHLKSVIFYVLAKAGEDGLSLFEVSKELNCDKRIRPIIENVIANFLRDGTVRKSDRKYIVSEDVEVVFDI